MNSVINKYEYIVGMFVSFLVTFLQGGWNFDSNLVVIFSMLVPY